MRIWKNLEKLYPYMQAFLLMAGIGVLASSYCVKNYPGWRELPFWGLLFLAILALGLVFVFRSWTVGSVLGSGGILLAFFGLFSGWEKVERFVGWLVGVPSEIPYPYLVYTILILFAAMFLLGLVLVFLMPMTPVLYLGGAVVFVLLLYWDLQGMDLPKKGVIFLFVYLLTVLVEIVQRKWEKRSGQEGRKVLVSLAPFFLVFFMMLTVAPTASEAYQWGFLTGFVEGVQEFAKQVEARIQYYLEGDGIFSLSFSGTGSGKVGGAIVDEGREYLTVNLRSNPKTTLYVIGSVWETFADGEWTMTDENTGAGEFSEQDLDYMQLMYGVACVDPERKGDYIQEISGSLTYGDIYTKTMFYLPKQRNHQVSGKRDWIGSTAEFEKPKGKNTLIQFSYLQMNLGSEMFDDLLEKSGKLSYEQSDLGAIDWMKENISWKVPENLTDLLAEREEKIRQVYGDAPAVTEKVAALVEQVTKSGENGYEKLKLLESYLGQYTYTTNPKAIEGDFLEGFLCGTKEGYCTHFATAFVELARYLGYPARYVQGFAAQPEKQSARNFTIWSGDSHAWAEVYFHGVGWIPFEPVPGYGELRYTPWAMKQTTGPGGFYEEDKKEDWEEIPEVEDLLPVEEEEKENKNYGKILVVTILVVAGAAGFFWLIYGYLVYRIQRNTEEEQYFLYWKRIFYLLSVMGMKLEAYDTMEDFRLRLEQGEEFAEILPKEHFEAFGRIRYGGEKVGARELKDLQEASEKLLEEYKKTHPKMRFAMVSLSMLWKY